MLYWISGIPTISACFIVMVLAGHWMVDMLASQFLLGAYVSVNIDNQVVH